MLEAEQTSYILLFQFKFEKVWPEFFFLKN